MDKFGMESVRATDDSGNELTIVVHDSSIIVSFRSLSCVPTISVLVVVAAAVASSSDGDDDDPYNDNALILLRNNSCARTLSVTDDDPQPKPHVVGRNHDDDDLSIDLSLVSLVVVVDDRLSSIQVSLTTVTRISSQCLANHIRYGNDRPRSVTTRYIC